MTTSTDIKNTNASDLPPLPKIRTYESDVAALFKGGKASLITIASEEIKKKDNLRKEETGENEKERARKEEEKQKEEEAKRREEMEKAEEEKRRKEEETRKKEMEEELRKEAEIREEEDAKKRAVMEKAEEERKEAERKKQEQIRYLEELKKQEDARKKAEALKAEALEKQAEIETAKNAKQKEVADLQKPKTWLVISFILIVLALGGGGGAWYYLSNPMEAVPGEENPAISPPAVQYEAKKEIDVSGLSREKFLERLSKEINGSKIALSGNLTISFSEKNKSGEKEKISAERFFQILEAEAPASLIRSVNPKFVFGLHSSNTNHPFIIFKTNYYENTFDGMLTWEKKALEEDFGPIFMENPEPETATTSVKFTKTPQGFEDKVFRNKDTRAIIKDGKTIFLYTFPNKDTILFTDNENTMEAVEKALLNF